MDEPFIVRLKVGDFVTVPYTFHMNNIVSFPFEGWNPAAYEQALKDEFDQLYEEGAHRRRMMVDSLHDRISGHANRVRMLDRFLTHAKSTPGVWFARKDEIARWALNDWRAPEQTYSLTGIQTALGARQVFGGDSVAAQNWQLAKRSLIHQSTL
jgi:hypothetical protein